MRRARGCGGRFLNKKGDSSNGNSDSSRSEGQSSQGPTTPDSKRRSDRGGFEDGDGLEDPGHQDIDQAYQLNI